MVLADSSIEGLLQQMHTYQAPPVPKWIKKEEV